MYSSFVYSEESSADEFSDEKMSNSDDDSEPEELNLAERRAAMDKLVPGLGPSEYGQMPASYHANSQRVAPTMETGVDTESNSPKKDSKPSAESETPMKPIRQPILPRDKYDGVDSDDETDDEDGPEADDESEEDQPQVVGEVEVDMGEEEEEFLEFSRQALGISDEQWGEIVRDRKGRGGSFLYATYVIRSLTLYLSVRTLQCDEHACSKNLAFSTGSQGRKTEACTRSTASTRTATQCQPQS